jgi:hypothetical protein
LEKIKAPSQLQMQIVLQTFKDQSIKQRFPVLLMTLSLFKYPEKISDFNEAIEKSKLPKKTRTTLIYYFKEVSTLSKHFEELKKLIQKNK